MSNIEISNFKNSLKIRFLGFGSVKKGFLMVQRCLKHIPKLILIGKSLANYLNNWSRPPLFSTVYVYIDVFYVCILCMYSMSVFYVWTLCILWMYSLGVFHACIPCMIFHACILCIYSMYWHCPSDAPKQLKPKTMFLFLRFAGNHLKRCALMHWLFFLSNGDTKCLFRGVTDRNTEAKKAKPKIKSFWRVIGNHLKRCALMHWSVLLLSDGTKCLFRGVHDRNTEAQEARRDRK